MKYIKHYKYYFCRVLDKAGILKYFSFSFAIKAGAGKVNIPVINGNGYFNLFPVKEMWMETIVEKCLRERKGSFIDVGVNLGQTLLKIALLNIETDYYGFEPNPVCYTYSQELVKKNKLESFRVFPVGLSDKASVLKLYGDNDHASGATVVENFRNNKNKYKVIHHVPVMPGDDVLQNESITAINIIKIDVEGAELEVIKGLQQTIIKYKPVIIIEILPVYTISDENGKMRKERQDQLLQIMRSMEFDLFLIKEKEVKLEKLNDIPVHGDMGKTNYLMIHNSQLSEFNDLMA